MDSIPSKLLQPSAVHHKQTHFFNLRRAILNTSHPTLDNVILTKLTLSPFRNKEFITAISEYYSKQDQKQDQKQDIKKDSQKRKVKS